MRVLRRAVSIYASLGIFASDFILENRTIKAGFYLTASILLIVWGFVIIANRDKQGKPFVNLNLDSWFKKGFVIGISNPVTPFIYLTVVQLLKDYAKPPSLGNIILFILVFEGVTFLTTALVALILLLKRDIVMSFWKRVKVIMGVFLICLGSYYTFQQIDFRDGITIKSRENFLKKTD